VDGCRNQRVESVALDVESIAYCGVCVADVVLVGVFREARITSCVPLLVRLLLPWELHTTSQAHVKLHPDLRSDRLTFVTCQATLRGMSDGMTGTRTRTMSSYS
jgi:hypothetical protein